MTIRSRRYRYRDALLHSQFNDLEKPQPDEKVLTIELGSSPKEIVERIKAKLNLIGSN